MQEKEYTKDEKVCQHTNAEKEIIFGCPTGDWICPDCGMTFTENPKIKRGRN